MATIIVDTFNIIGIYKITNLVNGKHYVGQSVNIKKRWQSYYSNCKDRTPIIHAIKKHGKDNFTFQIIEECNKEQLNEREIYWIKELKCLSPDGYNLSTGGRKTTWAYKPSKETLLKRSIALTGKKRTLETKRKMSEALTGRVFTSEHINKLRLSHIGQISPNKGVKMSEEIKAKMIATKTGSSAPWRWKSIVRSDGVIFESIQEAAKSINAHRATSHKHLSGKLKTVHGYTFNRGGVLLPQ